MEKVDTYILFVTQKTFLIIEEDIFNYRRNGSYWSCRTWCFKTGDTIEIIGIKDTVTTTVTGLEMFQKTLDETVAGDNVGVLLRGVQKKISFVGWFLQNKTIDPHTKFDAQVYVLNKEKKVVVIHLFLAIDLNFMSNN
jgi:elongation factor Tu